MGVPPKEQCLIYLGLEMKDDTILESLKMVQHANITLLDIRDTPPLPQDPEPPKDGPGVTA